MSTNSISAAAAAGRENARQADGKFGEQAHSEAGTNGQLGLDNHPPMSPMEGLQPQSTHQRGVWRVDESTTITTQDGQFTQVRARFGGHPHLRARNTAALAQIDRVAARAKVDAFVAKGKPFTALKASPNGDIEAVELRPVAGFCYLKGSRTTGYNPNALDVIDVEPGYGGQDELAARWDAHKAATTPAISKIESFDDLPTERYDRVQAAYLIEHPGFGEGAAPGGMFLATDRDVDSDMVHGFYVGGDSGQTVTEDGSFSTRQLQDWGGKIDGYLPGSLSFAEACELGQTGDVTDDYRRVLGR